MNQSDKTQSFTVADPATFDGDPFEVAERALQQSAAIARILRGTLKGARAMARNAEMERHLYADGECDAREFENSPQARALDNLLTDLACAERTLKTVAKAAAYNPRKPPRA